MGLAIYVAGYDLSAIRRGKPTLSAAYHSALLSHPIPTLAVTVYVVAHLMKRWPSRYDPLSLIAARVGR